ncbi:hypothetical protein HDU82_004860 [Entophlyctis luteolus]|nr:hypothetical protein HDU82_004860 [Entophlyctis luteolus]KAJ3381614.1 hypothetical protein HDU84_004986 [Entophlyctis sp. JEL0112]
MQHLVTHLRGTSDYIDDILSLLDDTETALVHPADREAGIRPSSRKYFESCAWIRLVRGLSLLRDHRDSEGVHWIALSLDYVPQQALDQDPMPPSQQHRLSRLTHTLLPLLCFTDVNFPSSVYDIESHPNITTSVETPSGPFTAGGMIPSFSFYASEAAVRTLETVKAFANLNRILTAKCDGGFQIWRIASCEMLGSVECEDLQWMITLGTFYLYNGKIRIWLRSIFSDMQERPVGSGSSFTRIIPTLQDAEIFLFFLIVRNYVACVEIGKARSIAEVLWMTVCVRHWKPTKNMNLLWANLLENFSKRSAANTASSFDGSLYLRNIRSLSQGILDALPKSLVTVFAHVALVYSALAISGTQDCHGLAVTMSRSCMSLFGSLQTAERNCSFTGFFAELCHGMPENQANVGRLMKTIQSFSEALSAVPALSPARILPLSPRRVDSPFQKASPPKTHVGPPTKPLAQTFEETTLEYMRAETDRISRALSGTVTDLMHLEGEAQADYSGIHGIAAEWGPWIRLKVLEEDELLSRVPVKRAETADWSFMNEEASDFASETEEYLKGVAAGTRRSRLLSMLN